MPAHFVNVTKEDFEEYLLPQGFKPLSIPKTVELVYGKRVDRDGLMLTLRIYTGINPDGQSRKVGADAMRCTIFWRDDTGNAKMIGGSKRVHRVEGWRKNLQKRLDAWEELLGPSCECGCPMVKRDSKNYGEFWGCSSYPACKKTKTINGNNLIASPV